MNLTSIWSDPVTVVTVLMTWALGLPELPAPLPETGCTLLGAGCQIVESGWRGAFLQVRMLSTSASSLAVGQAVTSGLSPHTPCPAKQSRTASLSASLRGVHIGTPSDSSAKCPPALPLPSPRKHATTQPQPTKYPPRVPPSAPHRPPPRWPVTPPARRSRRISCGPLRCTGGPQGPRMQRSVGAESRT